MGLSTNFFANFSVGHETEVVAKAIRNVQYPCPTASPLRVWKFLVLREQMVVCRLLSGSLSLVVLYVVNVCWGIQVSLGFHRLVLFLILFRHGGSRWRLVLCIFRMLVREIKCRWGFMCCSIAVGVSGVVSTLVVLFSLLSHARPLKGSADFPLEPLFLFTNFSHVSFIIFLFYYCSYFHLFLFSLASFSYFSYCSLTSFSYFHFGTRSYRAVTDI